MNEKLIKRISQISGLAAISISVLLAVIYYIGVSDTAKVDANVDLMMTWTIILLVVIVAFVFLVGPILSILTNPKSLVKGLISIGLLVVVFLIALVFSSNDVSKIDLVKEVVNLPQKAKIADIGIISFYIITGLTVLAILASEVKNLLKL
ncbi:MAG: hypothetical protein JXL97_06725 [Bacteroidales bacterium]|nr:hypothetical protein [Bacteroidales bacterium]